MGHFGQKTKKGYYDYSKNRRGKYTSDSTIATAMKIGKIIGKIPVLVGNCFGFVGNRMIFPYTGMAARLVEEGSSPYEIDKIMSNFGMPMGPFQMSDLSGLDVGYKIRTESGTAGSKNVLYPFTIADKIYEMGHFGQKTKKGYYDYSKNRRGKHTSDSTIATAMKIGKIIGKIPVLVGNCFGFVGNRMIFPYTGMAARLVEEGSSPYEIDKIMSNFGMPMGPFQMSDLSGLDVGYKIRTESGTAGSKNVLYPFTIADKIYEMGHFGQKTKKGYYDYSKNRRGKHTSDSTIATAMKIGKIIGKIPVLVGNCFGFVGNRMIFPYTGMAARLVEEGSSPYEIDKIMSNFGMPMGPFQMSDLSGLDVGYKIRTESGTAGSKNVLYPFTIADKIYEMGHFGQKTKKRIL
jgi:3-hydroxyacyl-CoA dehydrogenase